MDDLTPPALAEAAEALESCLAAMRSGSVRAVLLVSVEDAPQRGQLVTRKTCAGEGAAGLPLALAARDLLLSLAHTQALEGARAAAAKAPLVLLASANALPKGRG